MTPTSREPTDEFPSADTLHDPLDSLSIELSRISAEIQSINSGFQAQMQQSLAKTSAALENQYRAQFEQSMHELREQVAIQVREELRAKFEAELERHYAHATDVQKEIQQEITRVTALLHGVAREIAAMLDDPSIELSRLMRKRTEQAELKSYLEGLRFVTVKKL